MYKSKYSELYYKKNAANKYKKAISNKYESFIWELEKEILFEEVSYINKHNKIDYLDFACGNGRIINYLGSNFKFLALNAADTSKEMLDSIVKVKNKNIKCFHIDNKKKNPLKGLKKYELVTAFRLILNLEEENRSYVLEQINSLLEDDGLLMINNHMNRYSILGLTAYFLKKILKLSDKGSRKNKTIIKTMTDKEFRGLLEKSGFEVLKVRKLVFFPGYNNFIVFPKNLLYKIEKAIYKIPILNIFSKDYIYVCRKSINK